MRIALNILLAALTVLYPFAVYFGQEQLGAKGFALILFALFSLRFIININKANNKQAWLLLGLMAIFSLFIYNENSIQGLLLYPVIVNSVFFTIFYYSLFTKTSIIERLARIQEPDLPPSGIRYTRKVTQAWCLFFIFNGSMALYTALYCDMKVWSLYNGMIAYILIAILFLGELPIRHIVKRKEADTCKPS